MKLDKEKSALIGWILIAVVVSIILMFGMCGCQSAPDKKNFLTEDCYQFSDCLYRNQKDTSKCVVIGEACRDSLKEKRTLERLKFCEENEFKNWNTNECRMFLNQK